MIPFVGSKLITNIYDVLYIMYKHTNRHISKFAYHEYIEIRFQVFHLESCDKCIINVLQYGIALSVNTPYLCVNLGQTIVRKLISILHGMFICIG
jgi:hypothetical protein